MKSRLRKRMTKRGRKRINRKTMKKMRREEKNEEVDEKAEAGEKALESEWIMEENGTYHVDDLLENETEANGEGVGVVENRSFEAVVAVLLK